MLSANARGLGQRPRLGRSLASPAVSAGAWAQPPENSFPRPAPGEGAGGGAGKLKAVFVTAHGSADVLQVREAPFPQPGPGQVRVRLAATTVNFADIQGRRGRYPTAPDPPFIPGLEAAGTIDALGPGVTGFEVGQQVFCHAVGGSYAEFVLGRTMEAFPLPDEVSFENAACIPSVGVTAFNLLTQAGRMQPGETVLIHAAAGGVGSTAVQLARVLGAGIIIGTVGSAEKAKVATNLGADATINYRQENVLERVRALTGGAGADIVLDAVGANTFETSVACLAPFGRLVCYGQSSGPPPPIACGPLYAENKSIIGYSTGGNRRLRPDALRVPALAILKLLEQGRWKPLIGARYSLDHAAEAHQLIEDRESIGKVILTP